MGYLKCLVAVLPLLFVVTFYGLAQAVEDYPDDADIVPGEIVVKFKEIGPNTVHPAAAPPDGFNVVGETSNGALKLQVDPSNPEAQQGEAALKKHTLEQVGELKQKNYVEYAHPNYRVRAQVLQDTEPNDPKYQDQWAFNDHTGHGISLRKLWEFQTEAPSIVVAVLDTGITKDNEDIDPDVLVAGYDFVSKPEDSQDGHGRDPDPSDVDFNGACLSPLAKWHGTQVASLIGAVKTNNQKGIAGINWKVKIQPIRVMGPCGGDITDVADAIRWAVGKHVDGVPDNITPARIINLSMEGKAKCSDIPEVQSAIDEAIKAGAIIVVAAGNYNRDVSRTYPASCNGVIVVAASDVNGKLTNYSGYGPGVTIMAPGGDFFDVPKPTGILTAVKGDYAFNKGTSFSAPIVSGVLALWLAAKPSLSHDEVLQLIKSAAIRRDSLQCPRLCGFGLFNAFPFPESDFRH